MLNVCLPSLHTVAAVYFCLCKAYDHSYTNQADDTIVGFPTATLRCVAKIIFCFPIKASKQSLAMVKEKKVDIKSWTNTV